MLDETNRDNETGTYRQKKYGNNAATVLRKDLKGHITVLNLRVVVGMFGKHLALPAVPVVIAVAVVAAVVVAVAVVVIVIAIVVNVIINVVVVVVIAVVFFFLPTSERRFVSAIRRTTDH